MYTYLKNFYSCSWPSACPHVKYLFSMVPLTNIFVSCVCASGEARTNAAFANMERTWRRCIVDACEPWLFHGLQSLNYASSRHYLAQVFVVGMMVFQI